MGATRKGPLMRASVLARGLRDADGKGIDLRTIRNWIDKRYIKGCKIGGIYYVNREVAERLLAGESPDD